MAIKRRYGQNIPLGIEYKNEYFNKGMITTNDLLTEGAAKYLANFKISNQAGSLETRDPFIATKLKTTSDEVVISKNSFIFQIKDKTNYQYIIDFNQNTITDPYKGYEIESFTFSSDVQNDWYIQYNGSNQIEKMLSVIDGDTFKIRTYHYQGTTNEYYIEKRYRLAYIDTPETSDKTYSPFSVSMEDYDTSLNGTNYNTMGDEAKDCLNKIFNYYKNNHKKISITQLNNFSEKEDQFGRQIVFIMQGQTIVNAELLKYGLANIYNISSFVNSVENSTTKEIEIPLYINAQFSSVDTNIYEQFNDAYNEALENKTNGNIFNIRYLSPILSFAPIQANRDTFKENPVVYKIDNDLIYKVDGINLYKNISSKITVNTASLKKDLEIFSDTNIDIRILKNNEILEWTKINTKYSNEAYVFLCQILIGNVVKYNGLLSLEYQYESEDDGIKEGFHLKTYNKPIHIEFQDINSSKPNIMDAEPIIPEQLYKDVEANVKGYTSADANIVLLETKDNLLGDDLENTAESTTKYIKSDKTTYDIVNQYVLEKRNNTYVKTPKFTLKPFFIAPKIFDPIKKKNYMYRWDLVDLTEKDADSKDKVTFRSAWTDLSTGKNISQSNTRKDAFGKRFKNLLLSDEYFILNAKDSILDLKFYIDSTKYNNQKSTLETFINQPRYNNGVAGNWTSPGYVHASADDYSEDYLSWVETVIEKLNSVSSFIEKEQESFKSIVELRTINSLITNIQSRNNVYDTDHILFNKTYNIYKMPTDIRSALLGLSDESGQILEDIKSITFGSKLNKTSMITMFSKNVNKKIGFVLMPGIAKITGSIDGETKTEYLRMWNTETSGFMYIDIEETDDEQPEYTKILPVNIPIINDEITLDPENYITQELIDIQAQYFAKDGGIQATFYLTTYESEEKLIESDTYYDILAYKCSSPVYKFQNKKVDYNDLYIDYTFDKESLMIKNCKYISSWNDRVIVYGNPELNSTIFISEEGYVDYFSQYMAFNNFDNEVIHVQVFKTILLVFTINDIYVVYPVDTTNPETGTTTTAYYTKKVVYNISTELKNKGTIKNISYYVTLISNGTLYLITPNTFIENDTEFRLTKLSLNVDSFMDDPLKYINERAKDYGISNEITTYNVSINANNNFIDIYYSSVIDSSQTFLIKVVYDVLNKRFYTEDTMSMGVPIQYFNFQSLLKNQYLMSYNDRVYICFNTDLFGNQIPMDNGDKNYDLSPIKRDTIRYLLDSGNLNLTNNITKHFQELNIIFKNINSSEMSFDTEFIIDDQETQNEDEYEIQVDGETLSYVRKQDIISQLGLLNNTLDTSSLDESKFIKNKIYLLERGQVIRIKLRFNSYNKFLLINYGIIYREIRSV